jgi:hypothetical protein
MTSEGQIVGVRRPERRVSRIGSSPQMSAHMIEELPKGLKTFAASPI